MTLNRATQKDVDSASTNKKTLQLFFDKKQLYKNQHGVLVMIFEFENEWRSQGNGFRNTYPHTDFFEAGLFWDEIKTPS